MKAIFLILVSVSIIISGCASTPSTRGRVVRPQLGTYYADFSFVDDENQSQSLSQHLEEFTVLVFTKCENAMHVPISEKLAKLVKVNQESGYAGTVGFDIHWSEEGCPDAETCHVLKGGGRLFSICDAQGTVRHLYGNDGQGQVFVIGPAGRIVDKDILENWGAIATRFRGVFENYVHNERQMRSTDG